MAKGWGVGRLYPERGLRPYGDLDLLVPVALDPLDRIQGGQLVDGRTGADALVAIEGDGLAGLVFQPLALLVEGRLLHLEGDHLVLVDSGLVGSVGLGVAGQGDERNSSNEKEIP